jgi:hypothetical protein
MSRGPRYHVKQLGIDGNKVYDQKTLLGFTDLRNGDPYDKFVIQADLRRIRDYYGVRGRPATVRESLHQSGEGQVHVVYQVEEKNPLRWRRAHRQHGDARQRHSPEQSLPGQILSFPISLRRSAICSARHLRRRSDARSSRPSRLNGRK